VIRATPFPFEVAVLEHADRANHGRAAARNLALPHLRSEVVLLLDSDMRLAPEAIERHLAVLARPGVVSVGDVVYENAATNVWACYLATRGKNKYAPASRIRPLDFATGNTALRSADLLAVGGFDEGFTGYGGEDTDLGLRLAERGLSFVFNAEAFATTVERKTVDEGLRQLDAFARTNLRRIRWAHPSGAAPYWLDRLESRRLRDRIMRALMNPMTDAVVRVVEPVAPFALRRRLLDYRVLRTVWRGYVEGQL
jgi:GT2 family glycosyltransferase